MHWCQKRGFKEDVKRGGSKTLNPRFPSSIDSCLSTLYYTKLHIMAVNAHPEKGEADFYPWSTSHSHGHHSLAVAITLPCLTSLFNLRFVHNRLHTFICNRDKDWRYLQRWTFFFAFCILTSDDNLCIHIAVVVPKVCIDTNVVFVFLKIVLRF